MAHWLFAKVYGKNTLSMSMNASLSESKMLFHIQEQMWQDIKTSLKVLYPKFEAFEIEHALEAAVGNPDAAEKILIDQLAARERVRAPTRNKLFEPRKE